MATEMERCSLTTDIWKPQKQAYITVTVHCIFKDWSMQSFVLTTKSFPERHTAVEISQKLVETTDEFSIIEKIVSVVHDQAANMELCCSTLEDEKGWVSMKCTAHLHSGLEIAAVSSLLGATRKLVGHFHHSVVATETLKGRCDQMKVKQKKLIRDCLTRWNSRYVKKTKTQVQINTSPDFHTWHSGGKKFQWHIKKMGYLIRLD